jgi:hypothetical protein
LAEKPPVKPTPLIERQRPNERQSWCTGKIIFILWMNHFDEDFFRRMADI